MYKKMMKKIIIMTGVISGSMGIATGIPIISQGTKSNPQSESSFPEYFVKKIGEGIENHITVILQDSNENMWVGTAGNGLWKSMDGINFNQATSGIGSDWDISSIYQDIDGNMWVGGKWNGLYKSIDGINFNLITSGIRRDMWITLIFQDDDGNIWVEPYYNGIYKSIDGISFIPISEEILGNQDIHGLIQDNEGTIWVGSNFGLYFASGNGNIFTYWPAEPSNEWAIDNIFQDRDGYMWIGTKGDGLWKSDKENSPVFFNTPTISGIGNDWDISSIYQDEEGNIWVGASTNGLWKSTDGSTFTQITNGIGNDWNVDSLLQDKDGNIWVGASTNGLWKKTTAVIFAPESTHITLEEKNQTIYISDQSITVNIPPADQIIIDGEIISKTKEVTQYTFDGTESPHKIEISISGQNYIVLVYVVESVEEINYVHYNSMPDSEGNTHLDIFLGIAITKKLSDTFLEGDSTLNFFEWISKNQIWNDLFNEEDNLWNILQNNFEIGALKNIDRNMIYPVPSTTTISYEIFRAALLNKIDDLTNAGQAGLLVKLDLNQASVPINFGTNGATETYWDNVLFS